MSEENKIIYCSQCGAQNTAGFKFCRNCGAKNEQTIVMPVEENAAENEIITEDNGAMIEEISREEVVQPIYEEVVSESRIPDFQEEFHINYEPDHTTDYDNMHSNNSNVSTPTPQYYNQQVNGIKQTNGNIGFAIASMVCGILSLLCCCLYLFSGVLAIAAIVLGIIAIRGKYDGKGMAIAGIVTGGIGLVFIVFYILIGGMGLAASFMDDFYYNYIY